MSTSPTANGNSKPPRDEDGAVGLANRSLSQGRRRMLDLVNKLHSTGVQVDIDLPQIAVIGSQSAGKSSLIESISGITLPRAAGTCTRCPTECRLAYSPNPWQCIVSLRFFTDSKGQPLGQAKNETFGKPIYSKTEVEERIRRAQRAILNPSKQPKVFLGGLDEDLERSELSFSMNCVSLQISGPDVADLSFCDLPGLIASVSDTRTRKEDIVLVQKLVTSYIEKPSCIILLTVACETDFENQGAHYLAKTYDPEGKRTIGVLTKPDRIPTGEESQWIPFITNEKELLENNWYCVKLPSSNDIKQNMTWQGARESEDDFFSTVPPWCELDAMYQKNLRTTNLVSRLSFILSDLIAKRLPEIQDELGRSISSTRKQLQQLPKAPSNDPASEIVSLLYAFSLCLLEHVTGVPDPNGLLQRIRPHNEKFRLAIRNSAPRFRPYERKFSGTRHIGPPTFLSNEEDEVYAGEASDEEGANAPKGSNRPSSTRASNDKNKIYIDEVLERAHCARTRELPGNFPFVVQKAYILEFLEDWEEPAMQLCQQVHDILAEYVRDLVHDYFNAYGQGLLEQRARSILLEHLQTCHNNAITKVKWLLEIEQSPSSHNTHYFDDYRTKFLAHYRGARKSTGEMNLMQKIADYKSGSKPSPATPATPATPTTPFARQPVPVPFPTTNPNLKIPNPTVPAGRPDPMTAVLAALSELGIHGVAPEDLAKLLPHDTMEPALAIMADVRAYFQVAYKRFTDVVILAVDHELVRGVERGILEVLDSKLGIHGPDGQNACKELAQENRGVAERRADLMKKLERLLSANRELLQVGV